MKRICLLLSTICCLLLSCKKDAVDTIEIRVQNATPLQIEKINISGGDNDMVFESLPSGFTTGYRNAGGFNLPNLQCIIYVQGRTEPFVATDNAILYSKPGQYTCQISYLNAVPTIKFTKE